ncbi:hypothetical protein [Actinoplanes sp. L3-i22]|uniref:hypothetical protein n=1 Tax=Actinoplanes sp. L3-i22 TaxID=2836373 RepID=UPI001C84AF73|nr:hypothetical protein [Actinoplanes sp. L3-i22]
MPRTLGDDQIVTSELVDLSHVRLLELRESDVPPALQAVIDDILESSEEIFPFGSYADRPTG